MLTLVALAVLAPQSVQDRATPAAPPIRVELTARVPGDGASMGWSPKGAKVPLAATASGTLRGTLELGAAGTPPHAVELARSAGADHVDTLRIDLDGDGAFTPAEVLTCTPSERNGKWWASFEALLGIAYPKADADGAEPTERPYPVALWFVEDPFEPDAAPVLRWSRRGWHEGVFTPPGGEPATVVLAESAMDGIFDRDDAWALDRDPKAARRASSRGLDRHAWLEGEAWRVAELDPHGRFVTLTRFDPGMTEAEERAAADRTAVDRNAPRAATRLAFRHDADQAFADAAAKGQRVFLDFETTWCGPCKAMDQWIYTAAAVVDAAAGLVCVKVDGDVRRDLVKRFGVAGYPTLLVLEPDGTVLRRAVGYQSVAATAALLRGDG